MIQLSAAVTIERDIGDEITINQANMTGAASLAVAIGNIIGTSFSKTVR